MHAASGADDLLSLSASHDSPDIALGGGLGLWIVALDELASEPSVMRLLSADEARRAARFRFEHLARRYAAARAALRTLLGAALGVDPAAVPLAEGPHGKPCLAGAPAVRFNVSRCDETAVIALTTRGEVGVDIEAVARVREPERLVAMACGACEAAAIAALPPALVPRAFLRCWTAKEAVLKALGVGLTVSLREVLVDADPRVPMRLRRAPGSRPVSDWTLHELELVEDGAVVSVAVAAADVPLVGVQRLDRLRAAGG